MGDDTLKPNPRKLVDIDLAARADFEMTKLCTTDLDDVEWSSLPETDGEHPSHRCKDYYRLQVRHVVEGLWRVGRLGPTPDRARRRLVMLCDGCEDCQPTDGSEPSRYPCTHTASATGAEVVLASEHEAIVRDYEDKLHGR